MRLLTLPFNQRRVVGVPAFELLTRFDTGQRCRNSFRRCFRIPAPTSPAQQRRELLLRQEHRHPVVDFRREVVWLGDDHRAGLQPLAGPRFANSSQILAAVRSGEPSRAVKYEGRFPPVFCRS